MAGCLLAAKSNRDRRTAAKQLEVTVAVGGGSTASSDRRKVSYPTERISTCGTLHVDPRTDSAVPWMGIHLNSNSRNEKRLIFESNSNSRKRNNRFTDSAVACIAKSIQMRESI